MSEKVKNNAFQFIYALDIVFIVWGHKMAPISLFDNWMPFYSFHVALFIFCAGYFYNSEWESNVKIYILHKVKKLLIPLFLWNVFYGILLTILNKIGFGFVVEPLNLHSLFVSPIIHGHQYIFNLGGWFVIPLFMAEVINVIVMRLFAKNDRVRIVISISYICIGLVGLYYSYYFYEGGDWFDYRIPVLRVTYFLCFLGTGILYRRFEIYVKNIKNEVYFTLIFIIQIIIFLKFKTIPTFAQSWMVVEQEPYIYIIVALVGIAFWVRVAYIIEPIVRDNKIIKIISNNTFSIMINHYLGFFVVNLCYLVFNKVGVNCFRGFDLNEFKTNISYTFLIYDIPQMCVFYSIAAIMIPILMQWIINNTFHILKKSKGSLLSI